MDPDQVARDADGVMRCRQCGFRYALTPPDIIQAAEQGLQAVESATAAVPPGRRAARPAPQVWSVNAYVLHCSQAAAVILQRIRSIATETRPALGWHDQDAAVEAAGGDAVPVEESLPALRGTVAEFVSFTSALAPQAWSRVGVHAKAGEVELADIGHDMGHELQHHAADIRGVGGV